MTIVEVMERVEGKVYWNRGETIEDFFPEDVEVLSIPLKGETDEWGYRTSGSVYISQDSAFLEVVIWHVDFGNHEYYYFPIDASGKGFSLAGEFFSWDETASDSIYTIYRGWRSASEYNWIRKVEAKELVAEFLNRAS